MKFLLFTLLLLGTFAEEVENDEYMLEDRDYTKIRAHISHSVMKKIQKKIAQKIGLKEVAHKRSFDRKISRVQRKIKKVSTKIHGFAKRLHEYAKMSKKLKVLKMKILQKKRRIVLAIKKSKVDMKSKIALLEIQALNTGKPVQTTQIKALELVQQNQAKKLVRDVVREEMQNKRALRHLASKKHQMLRSIAHFKGIRNILRNKLASVLKAKAQYMKKLQHKRAILLRKAIRYYKVLALYEKIKISIKHLEQRLDVEANEVRRQKFQRDIEYLNKKRNAIKRRVDILKKRKAERKVRKIEINKLKVQIKEYRKKFRAEKKKRVIAYRNTKRQARMLKIAYKKAERAYVRARNLEKRNARGNALSGARKAYFSAKRAAYFMKKDIRNMKNIAIEKVDAIFRGVLKLKLIDRKMRIAEHNLSIKEYEAYKEKVIKRLATLRKYGKRMDLCQRNRKLLRYQIKLNMRRLRHVNRKIRHSQRGIMNANNKIGSIHRMFRMIAIKEYRHMKQTRDSVIATMKELKREIKIYRFKKACSGVITRKRMNYLIKLNLNELKVLKLEVNDLKGKIKRVDDAIIEEKKQRLSVTKIDYHRAKAALAQTKSVIRKTVRRIQKNKEAATATQKIYLRKQLLMKNAIESKKLAKLDTIKNHLEKKVKMLKVRLDKLVAEEVTRFLAYKAKWETKKAKILAELKKLALKEKKVSAILRRPKICRFKRCKLVYSKKVAYLKAHKLQVILFRVNKKLQAIQAEYVRRAEAKSFHMIYKRFKIQRKAYIRVVAQLKHLNHQYMRLEKKIHVAEQRLPYLQDKQKIVTQGVVRSLEKIKRAVVTKIHTFEAKKTRVLKRYLTINKQYIIQLKKRIASDNKRKQELVAKRPAVLHAALYELIPRKQMHNERKLNNLDKELEALATRNHKDLHQLKEAIRTKAFLVEAVKPKVTCKGKIIDCRYCKILGRIVKRSLMRREEDRVILERLTHRCNKELPKDQARCLDVAMRITENAVRVFDPAKFSVSRVCKKIGVCGI